MGFDSELFLDKEIDSNLICVICYDVFEKPTTLCTEGHTFCRSCIDEMRNKRTINLDLEDDNPPSQIRYSTDLCPLCKAPYIPKHVHNRPLEEITMKLRVGCRNSDMRTKDFIHSVRGSGDEVEISRSCDWEGTLDEYVTHRSTKGPPTQSSCLFLPVKCPNKCRRGAHLLSGDMKAGHLAVCSRRPVSCSDCGTKYPFAKSDLHKDICPEAICPCRYCETPIKRKHLNMNDHFA
eukprot:scaffold265001_cov40-Attheya_sp.AAC.1